MAGYSNVIRSKATVITAELGSNPVLVEMNVCHERKIVGLKEVKK